MHCTRKISDTIDWIGGSYRKPALFENIFPIPQGVSYNSYAIIDEKTAVLDTVDASISKQFIENVNYVLKGRKLDYLVINHMEPDHGANIEQLMLRYPDMKIVANQKAIQMMNQFFDTEEMNLADRTIVVGENDTLSLGSHTLQFIMAPMVHWPEVMVTYEISEKILFSADAFGTFGAHNGTIFNDEINFDRDWLDDARRYYANIIGKYGLQVQSILKKVSAFEIEMLCPLHGPIWRNNIEYIIGKYDIWSRYEPEEKGVLIAYASMYGNTENVANVISTELAEQGMTNVAVHDISNTDISYLMSDAFKYSHIVLATPTYNSGIYPVMEHFILDMKALNLQNRTFALVENGSWASTAGKQMRTIIETLKNVTILDEGISIKSSLKEEQMDALNELVKVLTTSTCFLTNDIL